MPGRQSNAGGYRFGFNGKEQDPEVAGAGNQYDYGFRIYNPQYGRFLSVDPLASSFPWYTPYQFAGNKPIWAIDLDGLEERIVVRDMFTESGGRVVVANERTITFNTISSVRDAEIWSTYARPGEYGDYGTLYVTNVLTDNDPCEWHVESCFEETRSDYLKNRTSGGMGGGFSFIKWGSPGLDSGDRKGQTDTKIVDLTRFLKLMEVVTPGGDISKASESVPQGYLSYLAKVAELIDLRSDAHDIKHGITDEHPTEGALKLETYEVIETIKVEVFDGYDSLYFRDEGEVVGVGTTEKRRDSTIFRKKTKTRLVSPEKKDP